MFDDIFGPKKGRKTSNIGSNIDLGFGAKNSKPKRELVARSQKNEVLARQKNKCANCHHQLDPRATDFDHIKEVYKNGKSTTDNLQALCANCHKKKTHADKLKQTEKKKAQARKVDNSPLVGLFGAPRKGGKSKDPLGFGL